MYSEAAVTDSTGGEFLVETWFGDDLWKAFALGHQYHAMLVHFNSMFETSESPEKVKFNGRRQQAISAAYPFGGTIYLVGAFTKPNGILLQLPDQPPIEARFGDWRDASPRPLPYSILIDDGQATFHYRYEQVVIEEMNTTWFMDTVTQPAVDEIGLYRLHRRLLAAHCDGDADGIADLSTEQLVLSNRGALTAASREETRQLFESVFARMDYQHYIDQVAPSVTVSESGDIGWIAVQVLSAGQARESGKPFEYQWSWIMLAKRVDGRWLHNGNASNLAPQGD